MEQRRLREAPKRQRRTLAKPLSDDAARWPVRDRAIAEAYRTAADRMQALAEHDAVSRMTVSRAVKRHEDAAAAHVTCETSP